MNIKISFSIANTNNKDLLRRALKSIYKNAPSVPFEVLVVDNMSDDGSATMVKNEFPEVILTENKERYGYPKNTNINISKSEGEYVLVLNEDIEILPGSIDIGIRYMDEHPEVGLLACRMRLPDGSTQFTSGRGFPTLTTEFFMQSSLSRRFPKCKFLNKYRMSYWSHDDLCEVDVPLEAGMFVGRKCIEDVGVMDENLFFAGDGPEWAMRIKKGGWKIVFHPDVKIIHYDGGTSKREGLNFGIAIESLWSMFYYFHKHYNLFYAILYRIMVAVISIFWMIEIFLKRIFVKEKVQLNRGLKYYWYATKWAITGWQPVKYRIK